MIAAQIMGKEIFGQFGIILNTTQTFGMLVSTSMSVTGTKFLAEYRKKDPLRAGDLAGMCLVSALMLGLMGSIIVFVAAPLLMTELFATPWLVQELRRGAGIILLSALVGAQGGMLMGLGNFRDMAFVMGFYGLCNILFTALFTSFLGLSGAILALLVSYALLWVANSLILRRTLRKNSIRPKISGFWKEKEILWRFSLPHSASALLNLPILWICSAWLVRQPDGIGQNAIFSAVYRWRQAILFFPGTVAKVSTPLYAERLGQGDGKGVKKLLYSSLMANSGVSIALGIGLMVISPLILAGYGESFVEPGIPVFVVFVLATLVQSIANPMGNLITSSGRTWTMLQVNIVRSMVLLGSAYFLIDVWGALGLVSAMVLNALVFLLSSIIISHKIINREAS